MRCRLGGEAGRVSEKRLLEATPLGRGGGAVRGDALGFGGAGTGVIGATVQEIDAGRAKLEDEGSKRCRLQEGTAAEGERDRRARLRTPASGMPGGGGDHRVQI